MRDGDPTAIFLDSYQILEVRVWEIDENVDDLVFYLFCLLLSKAIAFSLIGIVGTLAVSFIVHF